MVDSGHPEVARVSIGWEVVGQIPVSLPFPCDLWIKGENGQQVGTIGQLREVNDSSPKPQQRGDAGQREECCAITKRPCSMKRKGWLNLRSAGEGVMEREAGGEAGAQRLQRLAVL